MKISMKSEQNGQPLPTDGKMVYTFVSPTKAYMSASIDDGQMQWNSLRKRPDGITFVQGTRWKKVE